MTQYPLGLHTRQVTYDAAGRISGYKHYLTSTKAATPTLDQSFNYDKNGQLTDIGLYATAWHIDYDANGNRTSVTIGTNTRAYGTEVVAGTTTPKSNRLKTLSNPAVSLTHLATGQTLSDDGRVSYTHYLNGRIKTITLPGGTKSVVFTYDADGRRLRKYTQNLIGGSWVVDQASVVHYVYDLAGHVLGEYNSSGAPLREYIWVGDLPVALFTPGATAADPPIVYYIHTDHLNTPRAVVDTAGNLRWRWIADPFGTAVPETNPAGLGAFVQNLRFPGQVADSETGLFYNMARYYDPMIGRYTQSDPIGLGGGINTYGYVGGNPLKYVDPNGLLMGNAEGGIGVGIHVLPIGVNVTYGIVAGTDQKVCKFVRVCMRWGWGAYLGTHAGWDLGPSLSSSTADYGGFGVGAGFDVAVGIGAGGGILENGGTRGVLGIGGSAGLDTCYTKVLKCWGKDCPEP